MSEAPMSTAGKARMKIWVACFLKMYQSELNPLSKISGGRKISRMLLGSILAMVLMDSPMTPMSLEK